MVGSGCVGGSRSCCDSENGEVSYLSVSLRRGEISPTEEKPTAVFLYKTGLLTTSNVHYPILLLVKLEGGIHDGLLRVVPPWRPLGVGRGRGTRSRDRAPPTPPHPPTHETTRMAKEREIYFTRATEKVPCVFVDPICCMYIPVDRKISICVGCGGSTKTNTGGRNGSHNTGTVSLQPNLT